MIIESSISSAPALRLLENTGGIESVNDAWISWKSPSRCFSLPLPLSGLLVFDFFSGDIDGFSETSLRFFEDFSMVVCDIVNAGGFAEKKRLEININNRKCSAPAEKDRNFEVPVCYPRHTAGQRGAIGLPRSYSHGLYNSLALASSMFG
jgi:hypothetical protein